MLNKTLIARNKCYGKGRGPNAVRVCHCAISPQWLLPLVWFSPQRLLPPFLPPFSPQRLKLLFSSTPTMSVTYKSVGEPTKPPPSRGFQLPFHPNSWCLLRICLLNRPKRSQHHLGLNIPHTLANVSSFSQMQPPWFQKKSYTVSRDTVDVRITENVNCKITTKVHDVVRHIFMSHL